MIVTAWVCWGGGWYDNNPHPEVYKKMYPDTEFNLRRIILTFKSPWPEGHDGQGEVDFNISSTFVKHLKLFLPRKTKKIQKKDIWAFLRHFTFIFYLSKVTKTTSPQVILDVKFPALSKSTV